MAINHEYLGRTFPAAPPYEVSRVKIAEFADAIGDPNPVYRDRAAAQAGLMTETGLKLVMVEPDERLYQMAYNVVSNSILWFAHHHIFDAPRRPKIDSRFAEAWDAYRDVNRSFADTICDAAAEEAVVLVQDYHLTLVPGMLLSLIHI